MLYVNELNNYWELNWMRSRSFNLRRHEGWFGKDWSWRQRNNIIWGLWQSCSIFEMILLRSVKAIFITINNISEINSCKSKRDIFCLDIITKIENQQLPMSYLIRCQKSFSSVNLFKQKLNVICEDSCIRHLCISAGGWKRWYCIAFPAVSKQPTFTDCL